MQALGCLKTMKNGDEKGRPSLSGPDRWLDSADPYIRSALLSEVVSANIQTTIVQHA
jgi:hypothetical protein